MLTFKRVMSLLFATALIVALFGAPVQAADAPIVIKLGHGDTEDNSFGGVHNGAVAFKQLVESRTAGKVRVDIHPNNQIGSPREMFESTKMGSLQMIWEGSSAFTGFLPEFMVFSMPYIFPNITVALRVLDGPFGEELSALSVKKTGVRLLTYSQFGWRNFTNNKRVIRTPADIKGLKMRTQEDPAMMKIVQSMGGAATPIAWGELYTALQQGVVDGEENPTSMVQVAKLYEVQKYMTMDGHILSINPFCINEKFYQSLPEDIRYIIKDSAHTAALVYNGLNTYGATLDVADLTKKGMQIYVPTEAEYQQFVKAAQGPVKEFVVSKIGKEWPEKMLKAIATETAKHKKN
ncbi:MAG: DctP family TRAP transporter solute-binding subunit [candidate division NC10 bacterium]